ncbi:hypothetical protein EDD27_3320 [Nonomuraea polychroma]|uniref:Uncharacterized protein n=1 Tax=Nonomuraea polychroma TaxID=46176 RepID=A0A438M4Z0_9ACTN|nr:hypothetical protein [Nonomuraea polychroma]RVX40879.1 hypothetical protein EDD27_3320 [Nonomuraea polychroma]
MPSIKSLILSGVAVAALGVTGAVVAVSTVDTTQPASAAAPPNSDPSQKVTPMPSNTDPSTINPRVRQMEADAIRGTGLNIPQGWRIVSVRTERHDDREVTVIRHQPGGYRPGGEHASVVLDEHGTILGFTRLEDGGDQALPSPERSEQIALDFLRDVAPDHVDGLKVEWANRHDETVTGSGGTKHTVSGMKVKMRHDNGLYTWVIVGPDGAVLTYERDITWDSSQGRRGTQMWLHDSWITAHDGTGPQPDAPYALATRRG